jgi:hypothetical protein
MGFRVMAHRPTRQVMLLFCQRGLLMSQAVQYCAGAASQKVKQFTAVGN